jgi:hypothetical protein
MSLEKITYYFMNLAVQKVFQRGVHGKLNERDTRCFAGGLELMLINQGILGQLQPER